jgi:hypothetical protein
MAGPGGGYYVPANAAPQYGYLPKESTQALKQQVTPPPTRPLPPARHLLNVASCVVRVAMCVVCCDIRWIS